VNVGPFTEGFISIEDLNDARTDRAPTRVAVVYSSLHKQVHNLPDLIPRETQPDYCQLLSNVVYGAEDGDLLTSVV